MEQARAQRQAGTAGPPWDAVGVARSLCGGEVRYPWGHEYGTLWCGDGPSWWNENRSSYFQVVPLVSH